MFEKIMVAFDGSEPSRRALTAGIQLAARFERPLWAITVVEGIPDYVMASAYAPVDSTVVDQLARQRETYTEGLLAEAIEIARASGVELITEAVAGAEIDSIVDAVVAHGCDLLVVGLRHHPGLLDRLVSKTASTLTERAPCSVLGVR